MKSGDTLVSLQKLVHNINRPQAQHTQKHLQPIQDGGAVKRRLDTSDGAFSVHAPQPQVVKINNRSAAGGVTKTAAPSAQMSAARCTRVPITSKQVGFVQSVAIPSTIDTTSPVSVYNIVPVMANQQAASGKTFVTNAAVNMLNVTSSVQLQPISMVQPTHFTLPTQIGNIVVQENGSFGGQWASAMQSVMSHSQAPSAPAQLSSHTHLIQLKNPNSDQFVAPPAVTSRLATHSDKGFERPQYLQRLTTLPDEPSQTDTWGAKSITRKRSKRNPSPRTFHDM